MRGLRSSDDGCTLACSFGNVAGQEELLKAFFEASVSITNGSSIAYVLKLNEKKHIVSAADIQKWSDGLIADGISKTTVGIYLRACRVIWYACEKLGYVLPSDYPFG